jgi:hypothetical protein
MFHLFENSVLTSYSLVIFFGCYSSASSLLSLPTVRIPETLVHKTNDSTKKLVRSYWNNSNICLMPSEYLLERSSRFLDSDLHEPTVIMKNLSDCFRVLSLRVQYDDNAAGAALLSPEHVEMWVYLWNVDFGRQVCVEIQRRGGDSHTFHKYAKLILDTSSGDFHSIGNMNDTSYIDSNYFKESDSSMEVKYGHVSDKINISLTPVDHILMLMNDDDLESRILGMESLCILSDLTKTNLSMAHTISRCVLFRENGDRYGSIQNILFHVIQKRCMPDEDKILAEMVFDDDSDDEFCFDNQDQNMNKPSEYQEAIRHSIMHGLTILANCLEVIFISTSSQNELRRTGKNDPFGSSCVSRILQAAMDLTHADLLMTLMEYVGQGDSQPHNACEAVRCLTLFCRLSPDALNQLLKQGVLPIVVEAQRIGCETNLRLEKRSTELLQVLGQTF